MNISKFPLLRSLLTQAILFCVVSGYGYAPAAVTLEDADSLWKFDFANTGVASNTQIIDSTGNHTANSGSLANLSWINVPATGPYGGPSIDQLARGLAFTPKLIALDAGTNGEDSIQAAGFTSTNATVSGNATLVTRLKWDGLVEGMNDAAGPWLLNNGLGADSGWLFGLTTTGALNFYNAPSAVASVSRTYTPGGSNLNVGEWYDIAMVLDDLGTAGDNTGRVTFYLVGEDGTVQTFTSTDNMLITNLSGGTLVVGSESLGTSTGNSRKTFRGEVDYLAMFDSALSEADVLNIFATPEPSRAFCLALGVGALLLRRRR